MPDKNAAKSCKDCDERKRSEFITALENSGAYKRTNYIPIDDKSHFERFGYVCGKDKISVVYDTKAKMLSVTAKPAVLSDLENIYSGKPSEINPPAVPPADGKSAMFSQTKAVNPRPQKRANPPQAKAGNEQSADSGRKNLGIFIELKPARKKQQTPAEKPEQKNTPKPVVSPKPDIGAVAEKPQKAAAAKTDSQSKPDAQGNMPEYKNGFALKNVSPKAMEAVLERIKALSGVTVTGDSPGQEDKAGEVKAYKIEGKQKQKVFLRFMPDKQSVQLQGRQCKLFIDVQNILYKTADYKTAVSSYIKQSGEDKTLSEIEKRLKKLMPCGLKFLPEQSKKDMMFALVDISNENIKLSDYSGLLVLPYRALERFIFELQTAEGINVKMIGQGFEKDDTGKYCIKSGYMKKIGSVVYNEVLSALYTEYFEKRNFYLHSDNSSSAEPRTLSSIEELKKIFNNLVNIIEYNSKKLVEINFSLN